MSGPSPEHGMASAMQEMIALLTPVGEAVDGYRVDCERRGYSPTVAEAMALDFHRIVCAQLMGAATGGSTP